MSLPLALVTIPYFDRPFWGATAGDYIWCGALILLALLLKKPFSRLVASLTARIAIRFSSGKYGRLFKSLIRKPVEWLLASVLFYVAFNFISLPLSKVGLIHFNRKEKAIVLSLADVIDHLFFLFAILFITMTLSRIIDFIYRSQMEHAHHRAQKERTQLLPLVKEVAKGLLWVISFFWILGVVFQVNIPALITGLGIGGVALALAAKESIENLFASLTILSDKPFKVTDTVKLGNLEGKVERIGFRSTRLRGDDGALYIIPNKKLVDESLENLTQRDTRGVKVVLNIKYGIAQDALQKMINELKAMVQQTLHVIEPVSVSLENFNEKVFQVIVSYHLPEPLVGSNEAAIRQTINLKTYEIVMKYTTTVKVATEVTDTASSPVDDGTNADKEDDDLL